MYLFLSLDFMQVGMPSLDTLFLCFVELCLIKASLIGLHISNKDQQISVQSQLSNIFHKAGVTLCNLLHIYSTFHVLDIL